MIKTTQTCILIFCFFITAQLDTFAQGMPPAIARKLRRDAARIALRMEAQKEDLRYANIIIPKDKIDGVYGLLSKIYNEDATAKSIEKCNVHTFPNPSIDYLVLVFDKNAAWAEALKNGMSETSNKQFNKILFDYDLVIDKYVQWNDKQDAITIRSKEPLNMAALAQEFYNIQGVGEIDLGIPKINGNDIVLKRIQNGWEVHYILRFGALVNNAGKEHIWKYRVTDAGVLTYLGESGEPLPTWMRCEADSSPALTKI